MPRSQTVLVSGATGLVGGALCACLRAAGYRVRALSRSHGDVRWDPRTGVLESGALTGVDAVVHLAGAPIARRWTEPARRRILESRVRGTRLLAKAILAQSKRPVFISASGTNYYGYRCEGLVDESTPPGDGFLAEVCRDWEGAAQELARAGVRTVFVRTGVVLSPEGGALAKMLPVFKAGVGGRIGYGAQLMSWISLVDLARVYLRAIEDTALAGPVNAVAPEVVTNAEFTTTLGRVLGRPTVLPVPAFAVKAVFGQMGRETLLANLGVRPTVLQDRGFQWDHQTLEGALRRSLCKPTTAN